MPSAAKGYLALWNDHADAPGAYDVWHTREHVGERLGVPGFRFVRRYAGGEGTLPGYFTLYGLDDDKVLDSPAYRRLLADPTPWSRTMRPGMRNFLRRGCRRIARFGAGTGGLLAASLFRLAASEEDAARITAGPAALPPFTALTLLRIEEEVMPVPFASQASETAEGDAILLVEGYEARSFRSGVAALAQRLKSLGLSREEPDFTVYRLAFSLDRAERERMLPVPREAP